MKALAESDLNDVLRVARLTDECTSFNELQAATLSLLEQVYRTSSCMFGLCKGGRLGEMTMDRFAARGLSQDYINLYVGKYCRFDILARLVRRESSAAPPRAMLAERSIRYDRFTRSKIYREYFRHFSIHHILCINLVFGQRPFGVVALYRSRRHDGFSMGDLAKAELIAASLSGAAHSALCREIIEDQADVIDALSSGLPCSGVVVLDSALAPLHLDAQARRTLPALSRGARGSGRLPRWFTDELRPHCEELLATAASEHASHERELKVRIPRTGQDGICHVRLLHRAGKAPLFVVCLKPRAPLMSISGRAREAGLSPREMDVVFAVSSGLTNLEIADALCVSVSTVQTHLRSIYAKLRIRNRTGLIHHFIKLN